MFSSLSVSSLPADGESCLPKLFVSCLFVPVGIDRMTYLIMATGSTRTSTERSEGRTQTGLGVRVARRSQDRRPVLVVETGGRSRGIVFEEGLIISRKRASYCARTGLLRAAGGESQHPAVVLSAERRGWWWRRRRSREGRKKTRNS